jgi:hypothetical protein
MRVQLVLVCVALCLTVTMARDGKGGKSGSDRSGEGFRIGSGRSGSGRREGPGSGSREGKLHTSLCALTNHSSGLVDTVECREGATCTSALVDFSIQGEDFSAMFCAGGESASVEEALTEEMLVLFMVSSNTSSHSQGFRSLCGASDHVSSVGYMKTKRLKNPQLGYLYTFCMFSRNSHRNCKSSCSSCAYYIIHSQP